MNASHPTPPRAIATLVAAFAGFFLAAIAHGQTDSTPAPVKLGSDNDDPSTRSSTAHRAMLGDKPHMRFYSKKFDLSGLPTYAPKEQVSGVVRVMGSNYIHDSYVQDDWLKEFHKFQPNIQVEFQMQTAALSFPALDFDAADLVMNHRGLFYDFLAFERKYGYDPLEIYALKGSYNVTGWDSTRAIVVNKDNPLKGISMAQLDAVFGSARAGGWSKATWHPEWARTSQGDIRTWGQLGLTGEWADKEIHTYGFSVRYSAALGFSDDVLKGSDKWNPNYQGYANYRLPGGKWYIEGQQIADHVAADKYAIGFILWQDDYSNRARMVPVAPGDTQNYVTPSMETLWSSEYPLHSEFYWYLNVKPGTKIKPAVLEFLKYVTSRQGQEVIENDGKYLPLNAEMAQENAKILADSGN